MKWFNRVDVRIVLGLVFLSCCFGLWGINWGLPSSARRDLFLSAEKRTPEFYAELEKFRADRYEKIGMNGAAYAGRLLREGKKFESSTNVLHCYSSYLVRSHDADEQQVLVAVSRLNPLKGKWFPHAYYYGGGYLYPLAAFLGAGHVLGAATLVPQVSFYYDNPDEMGKIFRLLHLWSVFGFMFSAVCLFLLISHMSTRRIGFWTSLFFILLPATLAFAKSGKPHIWVPGWTFLAILFSLKFQRTLRLRELVLSGLLMGCGLGTATSQWVFVPFLLWAARTTQPRALLLRSTCLLGAAAVAFFALNPTLPFHFSEFLDEVRFISSWYPFAVRFGAIGEFVVHVFKPSLTLGVFIASFMGIAWVVIKRAQPVFREWLLPFFVALMLVSFQMQAGATDPLQTRVFLAGLGLLCFFAVWFSFQFRWGIVVRWGCGAYLLAHAILYSLHFQSDRAPYDNPSLASKWIQSNVPQGAIIEIMYDIPTVDQLPPMNFSDYTFIPHRSEGAGQSGNYLIFNAKEFHLDERLRAQGYALKASFATSPLQRAGYIDYFTNANFPVSIYQKN